MFQDEAEYLHRRLKSDEIIDKDVLDIGCGTLPHIMEFAPFYLEEIRLPLLERDNRLLNLDLESGEGVDIVADCHQIPLENETMDVVLFFNVIEHVLDPRQVINDVHRVLRSSGVCYATAPGAGFPCHLDPIDTMLRPTTLEDWRAFFPTELWNITLFNYQQYPHHRRKEFSVVTFLRVQKR